MNASTYILIALGLIALFAVFLFNRLVALRQAWKRAFAEVPAPIVEVPSLERPPRTLRPLHVLSA